MKAIRIKDGYNAVLVVQYDENVLWIEGIQDYSHFSFGLSQARRLRTAIDKAIEEMDKEEQKP